MSNNNCNTTLAISKKQDILLIPIVEFFSKESNIDYLLGILLTDRYKLSLRIIDWFVTNYAKKHNIVINKNNKPFIVYLEYKSQLKAYSKKQFDPFCRRARIHFEYAHGNKFETTIGQLNFFRWAIENFIIEYIIAHYEHIEQDMTTTFRPTTTTITDSSIISSTIINSSSNSSGNSSCSNTEETLSSSSSSSSSSGSSGKKKSTITATKSLCKHNVKIIVSFD